MPCVIASLARASSTSGRPGAIVLSGGPGVRGSIMRWTLVRLRRVHRSGSAALWCAKGSEFLLQPRQLLGQLEHGLVLLGLVPLQVCVALFEAREAFGCGVVHGNGRDNADCRGARQS